MSYGYWGVMIMSGGEGCGGVGQFSHDSSQLYVNNSDYSLLDELSLRKKQEYWSKMHRVLVLKPHFLHP